MNSDFAMAEENTTLWNNANAGTLRKKVESRMKRENAQQQAPTLH
jgi:hypothetical protein